MSLLFLVFFFHDTATTEIYTLSLHDALPICHPRGGLAEPVGDLARPALGMQTLGGRQPGQLVGERSEEHTSELQSLRHLVCRLLLEKKKKGLQAINLRCTDTSGDLVDVCGLR